MSTLAEIESAAAELPAVEKRQLMSFLARQLNEPAVAASPVFELGEVKAAPRRKGHSILDIPVVSVGKILKPLGPDDDLLGEMLGETRF